MSDIMKEKVLALLNDDSITGHDIEVCRAVYKAATDWDARNKAGTTPFEESLKKVQGIKNIDDITALMMSDDSFIPGLFSVSVTEGLFEQKGKNILAVGPAPMLYQDPADYENPTQQTMMMAMMAQQELDYLFPKFGMTAEEGKTSLEKCTEFEKAFAAVLPTNEEQSAPDYVEKAYHTYTYDELKELEKNFPLVESLDAIGVPKADTYLVSCPDWLDKMSELYTNENVEDMKNYMLTHFIASAGSNLDREAYEKISDIQNSFYGSTGYSPDEEIGIGAVNSLVGHCMDYVYIDKYCTPELRNEITDICLEFKDYYRNMLQSEDWLSEETRNNAVAKLDAMKINAVYSDVRDDYSDLDIKDGMSMIEIAETVYDYSLKKEFDKINKPVDEDSFHELSTREINAYYNPMDNSINILSGILQGVYEPGQGYEHDLGTIGWVIGHEMSHAFDPNGAKYDKDGNYKEWWTAEDYAACEQRIQKLKDYMSKIIPFEGQQAVNGEIVKGEISADMTAVKASLLIAADHEGFDYDKYFRTLPLAWGSISLAEIAGMQNSYNEHPLNNIRVNVSIQQCDKFRELYDIKEGDGMYLAPDQNLYIW